MTRAGIEKLVHLTQRTARVMHNGGEEVIPAEAVKDGDILRVLHGETVTVIIGLLVLGAGLFYLNKDKNDPESRKIYTIISITGGVIALVCILLLIF